MAGVLRGKRHLLVRSQPWRRRRERGLRLARAITLVVLSPRCAIVTAMAHSTATPAKSEKCEHSSTEQKQPQLLLSHSRSRLIFPAPVNRLAVKSQLRQVDLHQGFYV